MTEALPLLTFEADGSRQQVSPHHAGVMFLEPYQCRKTVVPKKLNDEISLLAEFMQSPTLHLA